MVEGYTNGKWIKLRETYTYMDIILLLITVFMCIDLGSVVSACSNCTDQDFTKVQVTCDESNQNIIRAQNQFSNNNESLLCHYLFEFYYCVGEHVPNCLNKITSLYVSYSASPYDCHPSPEVTLKLQGYLRNSCEITTKSQQEIETTVKYNVITTSHPGHMEKQNSLNTTNTADGRVLPSGTFLLVSGWTISWFLGIV